jgi:magnesium-transporting ATPase (P-type)
MTDWYHIEETDVLARLETDPENGLDQAEAERRLNEHGLNELV